MPTRKGFTLVEVLVVIAIIGILATFVTFKIVDNINDAKDAKRMADIQLLGNAINTYSTENYSKNPIQTTSCDIGSNCPAAVNNALQIALPTLPTDPTASTYYTYKTDAEGLNCLITANLSDGRKFEYSCLSEVADPGPATAGVCGTKANTSSTGYAQSQTDWNAGSTYCSSGLATTAPAFPSTPNSSVSWNCDGTHGGSSTVCTAYHAQDGTCGTAAGANYTTAPVSNLCGIGSTTGATGSGAPTNYWSWSCNGPYGGAAPTCNANLSSPGVCGTASVNGTNDFLTLADLSAANLCAIGTLHTGGITTDQTAVPYTNYWKWTCDGVYGGAVSSKCNADKKVNAACPATPPVYPSKPATGTCAAGAYNSVAGVTGTGPWYWGCNGYNNGTNTTTTACSGVYGVNGVCTNMYGSAPMTQGYCDVGTPTNFTNLYPGYSGPYTWQCQGLGAGTTVSCSNQHTGGCTGITSGSYGVGIWCRFCGCNVPQSGWVSLGCAGIGCGCGFVGYDTCPGDGSAGDFY